MKKGISLFITLATCLSLCACGGGKEAPKTAKVSEEPVVTRLTKEEMLATAVEMDDYAKEMEENKLRAEAKYIGNNYLVTGFVSNIESGHVDVGNFTVALPAEDIIQLTAGQKITVVGKIDSLVEETSQQTAMGTSYTETEYRGEMSNGYFVTDTFELSGTLIFYYKDLIDIDGRRRQNPGDKKYWTFGLDMVDNNVVAVTYSMAEDIPVEHIPGKTIQTVTISNQELHNKDKITISAKIFGKELQDIELISIDNK